MSHDRQPDLRRGIVEEIVKENLSIFFWGGEGNEKRNARFIAWDGSQKTGPSENGMDIDLKYKE